ncbi:innexin inx2-like [Penaeus japonicus]|uniref:innexin inx2-like n=1 Tax=Penaeus japonicus TaxID=27405 RepID=UPI001C71469B|nr:innexin inx2-like [Penaeus japonicus]
MAKEEGQEKIHALANYLHASLNRHKFYAIVLIVCENLNYVICLANLGFLNKFLDGAFFEYGFSMLSLIQHPPAERVDPLLLTFPRVAKCTFYKPTHSGSIERYDLMCTLAYNGTSEKIFVFLCFYFIILTALGSAVFLFYLIICFSPSIRLSLLRKKGNLHSDIDRIKNQLGIGEFVLLYLLSKNVEFHAFSMLMEELSNKILGIKRTNVYPNSSTIESIPLERITENV